MFLTSNKNIFLSRIWILYRESDGMEIRITNEEYYKHDPEK